MLSNRAPLARNQMHLAEDMASTVLKTGNNVELLMTSVPPSEETFIEHISGMFMGRIPLRTSLIKHWPEKMPQLQCLHCGGQCSVGPPIPAARQYESQIDQYWVYGPFCRPCCATGYICENDNTSKQLAPTIELMRRYFNVNETRIAPPRASHKRFGGTLDDHDFYGDSGFVTLSTLQPPFVTFANYVVGVHQTIKTDLPVESLLPQSAGRLVDLKRPDYRSAPIAEKKPTGKAPLFLEFLATLTSIKDVKDAHQEIEIKSSPKKRKLTEQPKESINFLKKYVKKQEKQDEDMES